MASNGEVSMSIEETNKMRAALGLKPLNVTEDNINGQSNKKNKRERATDEYDANRKRLRNEENDDADAIRKRLAAAREERMLNSIPSLGSKSKSNDNNKNTGSDEVDDEDDVQAWIKKSRNSQLQKQKREQKERAARMAKLLEEQDDDFIDNDNINGNNDMYGSQDLSGLHVKHDLSAFAEGQTIVLTLEDQNILDDEGNALNEDEDKLQNTLIIEDDTPERSQILLRTPKLTKEH